MQVCTGSFFFKEEENFQYIKKEFDDMEKKT